MDGFKKYLREVGPLGGLVLVLLVVMVLGAIAGTGPAPAEAAPPAAVTPIANTPYSADANYFVFLNEKTFAADGYSDRLTLASFEVGDWQYLIDTVADVNTTTVTIQYSNDGENWVAGQPLISANIADAGDIVRLPLFGRYARLHVNSTTTDTLTLSVNVLAK